MTWIFALFMLVGSAAPKLIGAQVVTETMTRIGWPTQHVLLIGFIELTGTVLFIYSRTAFFGAILLTGLFGGAIASQLRVDSPILSHTLFGVYLGAIMWGSLWLRDSTLRNIFPFTQNAKRGAPHAN